MITCLGLIVGIVESDKREDVLRQCARFLESHRYLCNTEVTFEIDNFEYAVALDTHDFDDGFGVLFRTYDGRTVVAMS